MEMNVRIVDVEKWTPSVDKLKSIIEKHNLYIKTKGVEGEKADLTAVDLSIRTVNRLDDQIWGDEIGGGLLLNTDARRPHLLFDLKNGMAGQADLSGTNIGEHDWSNSHLQKTDLSNSVLWKTNFTEARLVKADLTNAHAREAKFEEANLTQAKLWGADLSGASLHRSKLQDANLWGADLTNATLLEANLRNADLGGTSGLQVQALARANTSNATLPDDVARFEGLEIVEAASQSARKLFITLGLGCAYAALAISTKSAEGDTLTLPFVQVDIGLWGFYHVVPVLLALAFGYFHLQMQRVWDEMAQLPAIFPDGKAIDQKVHPWLVTGIARVHIPFVRDDPVRFFPLQWLVALVMAWGLVPLTQGYFVVRFIDRYREWALYSGWGTALVALTLSGAVLSYLAARGTLRGDAYKPFRPFANSDDDDVRRSPRGETILRIAFTSSIVFGLWFWWLAFGGMI
jgi:uncharacterized protein YjbI with pentapeptide repeats